MRAQKKNASVILVLVDIDKHTLNGILDTVTSCHFDEVVLCGSTPIPDSSDQHDCKWSYYEDPVMAALELSCQSYEIVVEGLTDDSELLTEAEFYSSRIACFVGNISAALQKEANRSVHHQLHHKKRKPNACVIVGALMHDIFCRREANARERMTGAGKDYREAFPVTKVGLNGRWSHRGVH